MNNKERLKAVKSFLDWVEYDTDYQIVSYDQCEWGDGESTFCTIRFKSLFKKYKELIEMDI